jgi:hypothetical protein
VILTCLLLSFSHILQLWFALHFPCVEIYDDTETGSIVDQLNRILDVLGTPDEKVFDRICSEKVIFLVRSLTRLILNRPKLMSGHCPSESLNRSARSFRTQMLKVLLQFPSSVIQSTASSARLTDENDNMGSGREAYCNGGSRTSMVGKLPCV